MVGSDNILGLLPAGCLEVATNGPADTFLHLWLVTRYAPPGTSRPQSPTRPCPRRSPGRWRSHPLVHGGDGEIHWGLGGLDIGVVRFSM